MATTINSLIQTEHADDQTLSSNGNQMAKMATGAFEVGKPDYVAVICLKISKESWLCFKP